MKKIKFLCVAATFVSLSLHGSQGLDIGTPEQPEISKKLITEIRAAKKESERMNQLNSAFDHRNTLPSTKRKLYMTFCLPEKMTIELRYGFLKKIQDDPKITLETMVFLARTMSKFDAPYNQGAEEMLGIIGSRWSEIKHASLYNSALGDYKYLVKSFEKNKELYRDVLIDILNLVLVHPQTKPDDTQKALERLTQLGVSVVRDDEPSLVENVPSVVVIETVVTEVGKHKSEEVEGATVTVNEESDDDWETLNEDKDEILEIRKGFFGLGGVLGFL